MDQQKPQDDTNKSRKNETTKEKSKRLRKEFLSRPDIQAKLADRKEKLKQRQRQYRTQQKEARKISLKEKSSARKDSRVEKDNDLKSLLKPALTLIKGGRL